MGAVVCGISSVRRIVCPFQYEVESIVNLAPCFEPVSAGFLYEGDKLMYSVTAPDPWM